MPFLTIFTRCCKRPIDLRKNIETVLQQSSKDWEQLFIVDPTGRHDNDPILWANTQFERYQHLVNGQYVYALDDDGFMVDPRAIQMMHLRAAERVWPEALLVKMRSYNLDQVWRVHPQDFIWDLAWEDKERPSYWVGTGFNIVTRADAWRTHLEQYQHSPGGDWTYITSLIADPEIRFARVDVIASESPGRGCGVIMEKCKPDWFTEIASQLELEQLEENAWRLRP